MTRERRPSNTDKYRWKYMISLSLSLSQTHSWWLSHSRSPSLSECKQMLVRGLLFEWVTHTHTHVPYKSNINCYKPLPWNSPLFFASWSSEASVRSAILRSSLSHTFQPVFASTDTSPTVHEIKTEFIRVRHPQIYTWNELKDETGLQSHWLSTLTSKCLSEVSVLNYSVRTILTPSYYPY